MGATSMTIVLPAYQEQGRLGAGLDELFGYLDREEGRSRLPADVHVLVVDDGSTDSTAAIVRHRPEALRSAQHPLPRLSVMTVPHGGKGAAVRAGILASDSDLMVFADADMATPPDEIWSIVAALEDHAVALGSRIQVDGSDMRASQPILRRLLGRAFHLLAAAWVTGPIQDTQCGFKGFTREAGHDLFSRQRIRSIVFDAEIIFLARRLGYPIAVVPVRWSDRRGSRMRPGPRTAARVAWDLLRIPVIHRHVTRAATRAPLRSEHERGADP
jgi:dolichyl-phosphate beta-glucosyltransferase